MVCTTAYRTPATARWLSTCAHMLSFPLILLTNIHNGFTGVSSAALHWAAPLHHLEMPCSRASVEREEGQNARAHSTCSFWLTISYTLVIVRLKEPLSKAFNPQLLQLSCALTKVRYSWAFPKYEQSHCMWVRKLPSSTFHGSIKVQMCRVLSVGHRVENLQYLRSD